MVGLKPSEVPPTTAVKFLGAGTAACFADLLTFPLDTAKVRLQVGTLWPRVAVHMKERAEFSSTAASSSSHRILNSPLTLLLKTLPCHLPVTIAQEKKILIPWHDMTRRFMAQPYFVNH